MTTTPVEGQHRTKENAAVAAQHEGEIPLN
jgi:hypothetical protein